MRPRLSLAAVPYFWSREGVFEFYDAIAGSPVDIVYLGETVCPKRRRLAPEDWMAIGRRLAECGKTPVLSTLTLIEAGSELGALRALCRQGSFLVEANDFAAVAALESAGLPFIAGPTLNLYNARALALVHGAGALRWVLPVELGGESVQELSAAIPGLETEVFAWGRLPLAYSARCFTARAEGRSRDDCGFACGADPDGRLVRTREGEAFLTLNGIQTQSALTHSLAADYAAAVASGVDVLRITPQASDTLRVIDGFDRLRRGAAPADIARELDTLAPVAVCNGYWHGRAAFEPVPP
ncbi:U32 family peptidase [Arhodomonas sp. SL1]|uniref:U32 family peptidase n=1 Tax=Arhodomonas sp. SL1 TaxID=3425691 RepID=UPI003F881B24